MPLFPLLCGFFSPRTYGYEAQKEPWLTKKQPIINSKNQIQTASEWPFKFKQNIELVQISFWRWKIIPACLLASSLAGMFSARRIKFEQALSGSANGKMERRWKVGLPWCSSFPLRNNKEARATPGGATLTTKATLDCRKDWHHKRRWQQEINIYAANVLLKP